MADGGSGEQAETAVRSAECRFSLLLQSVGGRWECADGGWRDGDKRAGRHRTRVRVDGILG